MLCIDRDHAFEVAIRTIGRNEHSIVALDGEPVMMRDYRVFSTIASRVLIPYPLSVNLGMICVNDAKQMSSECFSPDESSQLDAEWWEGR